MASNTCTVCHKDIKVAIFKGTGICSDLCRKELVGETPESRAQTDAGITNMLRQPHGEVNLGGIR